MALSSGSGGARGLAHIGVIKGDVALSQSGLLKGERVFIKMKELAPGIADRKDEHPVL